MAQVVLDFLGYLGVNNFAPTTISEFTVWIVLVMVCVGIIKFVLGSIFWLTKKASGL